MKFTQLNVPNFRHIKDQTIEIGNVLTAIAGQNGTGKSTLLGWIAQSCDAKCTNRTLLNSTFKSKYSEIFRFCPDQDYTKKSLPESLAKEVELKIKAILKSNGSANASGSQDKPSTKK